jgi:DNA-binding beta-propeller fold protein YncE
VNNCWFMGWVRIRCLIAILVVLSAAGDAMAAQGLWVANSQSLAEFQGPLRSGRMPAHRINRSKSLDGSSTIAFDGSGNLWVTNFNTNTIVEFTKAEIKRLRAHPAPRAAVTISEDFNSTLDGPEGLVFDTSGNMWVGAEHGQKILMYAPAQFAASGNPTAKAILNASSFSFDSPSHLAFDAAGNLWVVDEDIFNGNGGAGEVFRYTKAQITGLTAGTHYIDPAFGIALPWFTHLEGLAFDSLGNMWLADERGLNVYKFAADQLTGTGLSQNLTPAVVLSPSSGSGRCPESLDGPYGIAVDQEGNLFVSNANLAGQCFGSLVEFSAKSIESSGSPNPKVVITRTRYGNNINDPNSLTFGPLLP